MSPNRRNLLTNLRFICVAVIFRGAVFCVRAWVDRLCSYFVV